MQLSIPCLASLLCAVAATVTAVPSPSSSSVLEARDDSCVNPLLCCPELKTPLDPTVDPILAALGVNATEVVGSIGLECMFLGYEFRFCFALYMYMSEGTASDGDLFLLSTGKPYTDDCTTGPKCCTEAVLLVSFASSVCRIRGPYR